MTKNAELQAWRNSHFAELERTLEVLKGIRDDPEASNKDRIEASKSVGRLLAAMSPEKTGAGTPPDPITGKDKPTLSPEHRKGLDEILDSR